VGHKYDTEVQPLRYLGFELLTVVVMNDTILWDMYGVCEPTFRRKVSREKPACSGRLLRLLVSKLVKVKKECILLSWYEFGWYFQVLYAILWTGLTSEWPANRRLHHGSCNGSPFADWLSQWPTGVMTSLFTGCYLQQPAPQNTTGKRRKHKETGQFTWFEVPGICRWTTPHQDL
jgi:hypothetical protein